MEQKVRNILKTNRIRNYIISKSSISNIHWRYSITTSIDHLDWPHTTITLHVNSIFGNVEMAQG